MPPDIAERTARKLVRLPPAGSSRVCVLDPAAGTGDLLTAMPSVLNSSGYRERPAHFGAAALVAIFESASLYRRDTAASRNLAPLTAARRCMGRRPDRRLAACWIAQAAQPPFGAPDSIAGNRTLPRGSIDDECSGCIAVHCYQWELRVREPGETSLARTSHAVYAATAGPRSARRTEEKRVENQPISQERKTQWQRNPLRTLSR